MPQVGGPGALEAVIFDLGGVVLPSPFDAWAAYERELGLEVGFIRGVVARAGDDGAWARHERGEVGFEDFLAEFDDELSAAGGEQVSAAQVLARISQRPEPREEMLAALDRIRASGQRTAALTNNWAVTGEHDDGSLRADRVAALAPRFDVIVESAVEGLRKPDPRIYELTCSRLGVAPSRAVFLDDLGVNLKPARAMGMVTIKVTDPAEALSELGRVLDLDLG